MTAPADLDELQLLTALTDVLRNKREALMTGEPSADALSPIWQPLLDELAHHAERRRSSGQDPAQASPAMRAQASALRDEYEGLQHSLALWSAAVRQAMDNTARQNHAPVYGASAGAQRNSLGRG